MKLSTLAVVGATLLALALIAGKLYLSEASFSPANPSWDGDSALMTGDARPLYSFDRLPQGSPQNTLLIVGPSVNYTQDDASRVLSFLRQGGRVVVMDDFGTADSLLEGISSPVTIDPVPLCQDLSYYRKPAFPEVGGIGDSSLTANVSELVFNHPATLLAGDGSEVLAQTTSMGWMDANGDGRVDGNETFGSYPLIARVAYGTGELFVAGDADLAINSMQGLGDDAVLLRNVRGDGLLYIDVGHGQQVPPLAGIYYNIKYNIIVQVLIMLLIFIAGYLYVTRGHAARRHVPEEPRPDGKAALIASMRSRLPLSGREMEEISKKL